MRREQLPRGKSEQGRQITGGENQHEDKSTTSRKVKICEKLTIELAPIILNNLLLQKKCKRKAEFTNTFIYSIYHLTSVCSSPQLN